MANIKTGGLMAQKQEVAVETKKKTVALVMNELLDSNGIKTRINELLGRRAHNMACTKEICMKTCFECFREEPEEIEDFEEDGEDDE